MIKTEDDLPSKPKKVSKSDVIGCDLGLTHYATLSTGEKFDNPRNLRQFENLLKRRQRQLSRKQKDSKNREKARLKVARLHNKILNQRKDHLHKLSRLLVDENQVLAVETLSVKRMLKDRFLSKSISDASWGTFVSFLDYKSDWSGKWLLKIDQFLPSSKMCSACGATNQNLKLHHRVWSCEGCGTSHDRDVNAARNIATFAQQFRDAKRPAVGSGRPEFTPEDCALSGDERSRPRNHRLRQELSRAGNGS